MSEDQPTRTYKRPAEHPGHWLVIEEWPDGRRSEELLPDELVYGDPAVREELWEAAGLLSVEAAKEAERQLEIIRELRAKGPPPAA